MKIYILSVEEGYAICASLDKCKLEARKLEMLREQAIKQSRDKMQTQLITIKATDMFQPPKRPEAIPALALEKTPDKNLSQEHLAIKKYLIEERNRRKEAYNSAMKKYQSDIEGYRNKLEEEYRKQIEEYVPSEEEIRKYIDENLSMFYIIDIDFIE